MFYKYTTVMSKISTKNPKEFFCQSCNYFTTEKRDFNKHILTRKHKNNSSTVNHIESYIPVKTIDNTNSLKNSIKPFICEGCNKSYSVRNSLWYHKKKCIYLNTQIKNTNNIASNEQTPVDDKELIKMVLQQNREMINIVKNANHITNNITNTTNINNNQKTFNLQIFLNEDCKDAMNLTDFVNNIKLRISDVNRFGIEGYSNGISNIIVKELKSIDVTQRPIHCSDTKRETIYVKDDDKWEKDIEKDKINKMINTVENKNIQMLDQWKDANPGYDDYNSKNNDEYNQIIMNTMDGSKENKEKIIRTIVKEIKIDK